MEVWEKKSLRQQTIFQSLLEQILPIETMDLARKLPRGAKSEAFTV